MPRSGVANLPLHGGHAPRWLFKRMIKLSGEIVRIIAMDFGTEEVLRRFADPFWFQAFSCVIGFDWHSSGTTTVTMGALKQALRPEDGVLVAGGKGRASLNTPREIEKVAEQFSLSSSREKALKHASRTAAKVDNAVLQDGYSLYHHVMLISENGTWAVVQQGINDSEKYARRYHWLHTVEDFVNEPHSGIMGDRVESTVMNLVASESRETRKTSVELVKDNPRKLKNELVRVKNEKQTTLDEFAGMKVLTMPWHINWDALFRAYEIRPRNYEELINIKGVGPSTVRALAYISDIIYGTEISWKDPVKYSFAVGGKDGVPKPVDRDAYDRSIEILEISIQNANIGNREKLDMLKRLRVFVPENSY